jgi:hypothetical protein
MGYFAGIKFPGQGKIMLLAAFSSNIIFRIFLTYLKENFQGG